MNIVRTLQVDERTTSLAQAIAEIGRIDKAIYTLNFINDEARRRATLLQLNLGEGRHNLAREVFHGKRAAWSREHDRAVAHVVRGPCAGAVSPRAGQGRAASTAAGQSGAAGWPGGRAWT